MEDFLYFRRLITTIKYLNNNADNITPGKIAILRLPWSVRRRKKLGNEFELNISASFFSTQPVITEINQTINYAAIYELAKSEMMQPRELLETFLSDLAEKIKRQFPELVKLKMSLYKLQMPLTNFQGE